MSELLIDLANESMEGSKKLRSKLLKLWYEKTMNQLEKVADSRCLDTLMLCVEYVHSMSLIHDDLPAIDNSDTRRGKPTLHEKYSEGLALLTGDYMLAKSFKIISDCIFMTVEQKVAAINVLSKAAIDMACGVSFELQHPGVSSEDVAYLKTSSLFGAACELGVIAVSSELRHERTIANRWGKMFGLAYQCLDDIKDKDGMFTENQQRCFEKFDEYLDRCLDDASDNLRELVMNLREEC